MINKIRLLSMSLARYKRDNMLLYLSVVQYIYLIHKFSETTILKVIQDHRLPKIRVQQKIKKTKSLSITHSMGNNHQLMKNKAGILRQKHRKMNSLNSSRTHNL